MDAIEAIAEFIREQVGVAESELIDAQAAELIEHLRARGFFIVGPSNAREVVPEFEEYVQPVRARW